MNEVWVGDLNGPDYGTWDDACFTLLFLLFLILSRCCTTTAIFHRTATLAMLGLDIPSSCDMDTSLTNSRSDMEYRGNPGTFGEVATFHVNGNPAHAVLATVFARRVTIISGSVPPLLSMYRSMRCSHSSSSMLWNLACADMMPITWDSIPVHVYPYMTGSALYSALLSIRSMVNIWAE